jgi:hypothetical protein
MGATSFPFIEVIIDFQNVHIWHNFPGQPTPSLLGPSFDEISRLYAVSKGLGKYDL